MGNASTICVLGNGECVCTITTCQAINSTMPLEPNQIVQMIHNGSMAALECLGAYDTRSHYTIVQFYSTVKYTGITMNHKL